MQRLGTTARHTPSPRPSPTPGGRGRREQGESIMPANSSYIPAKDANALLWMETFANGIGADPSLYGLSAADSTAIQDAVDDFGTALSIAVDPNTRTPVNVNLKDTAR